MSPAKGQDGAQARCVARCCAAARRMLEMSMSSVLSRCAAYLAIHVGFTRIQNSTLGTARALSA